MTELREDFERAMDLRFLAHDYDARHQEPDEYRDFENELLTAEQHEPKERT